MIVISCCDKVYQPLRARLRTIQGKTLSEFWGFWMPPRGLSLLLCSWLLFLRKSAFLPFLGLVGSKEHLVGNCQLCSCWQLSAEGSLQTSRCNHMAWHGTTRGSWPGPGKHCSPIRPSGQPQMVSQSKQGYSLFYPGAPWDTSTSRQPHSAFGNQSTHQKGNPDW